jgi:hypothetical protein
VRCRTGRRAFRSKRARAVPGIGRKIVRNCFEGGFDIWREFLVELDDQKRYTGFAALEMPLPDVNAGDATRSNDGPTSVGPPYLGARSVIVIAPRCPNAPGDRTLRTGPQPCKQKGRIERPFFCCAMGARHAWLAVNGWMCSITLVLLDGPLPRPWFTWGHSGLRREVAMGISPQRCHVADLVGSCGGFGFVCVPTDGSARIDFDGCRTGSTPAPPSAIVKFHGGQS